MGRLWRPAAPHLLLAREIDKHTCDMLLVNQLNGFGVGDAGPTTWVQTWSSTPSTDQTGLENYSLRATLPAANISTSGSIIRLTITAHSGSSTSLDNVSIMEQSAGAAGTGSIGQFAFSGNPNVTISGGATVVSDQLSFALDETKSYLVTFDIAASNGNVRYAGSGTSYFQAAFNGYNTTSGAGYSTSASTLYLASKLEVFI